MNERQLIPRKRLSDGLKIVIPSVVLVAVGFAFLRRANQLLLPVALDFATAAAVGITAGLTTRHSLKGRAGFLHMIVAIAGSVCGLIILGLVTWGQAGIVMFVRRSDIDWNGLGQIIVGASSSLLVLRAWRASVQIAPVISPAPERSMPRPSPTRRPAQPRRGGARAVSQTQRLVSRVQAGQRKAANRFAQVIALPRWRPPVFPIPHFNFRNPFQARVSNVKLSSVSEQRCPYCLDLIIKNDPRGVRTCSICHTPHHADCWALTGVCQIPHYHN
jgi:hypothetical protein